MIRKEEICLEFQNYIDSPPVTPKQMFQQACSNDGPTIESWRDIWLKNVKANKARFGNFNDHSIAKIHKRFKNLPGIIAGSGPSLRHNASKLKNRGNMALVSCLHNFHFLEDLGANVDYYVTLDAGPVVIEEVFEGGTRTEAEYWAMTKEKTLLAFIGTDPGLFEKWQGEVLFYAAPVPDDKYAKAVDEIEAFNMMVSNGGNVLGACLYIAKVFLGCNPIIFTGADFCFGYDHRFHSWDSKYDGNLGHVMRHTDVFGNRVLTWQSYFNFKCWFDSRCIEVPGIWINATEGGCLGSYPDGNISHIRQMTLDEVLKMYSMADHTGITDYIDDPTKMDIRLFF